MGSRSRMIGRSACAAALSCILALSPALDGARAWAEGSEPENLLRGGGGASQLDSPAPGAAAGGEGEPEGSQRSETVRLPGAAGSGGADLSSPSSSESDGASGAGSAAGGQAAAEAPLSPNAPRPVAGEVRADGLVFRVLPGGASVALAGWHGAAPEGDVSIPAAVSSGADSFAVAAVGAPGADGASEGVFSGAPVASVSIPASVASIADGALSGCPALRRVHVSSENGAYASFDGMLFSKDHSELLLVPEGMEGAARIPDQADSVPAGAFSRAPGLSAVLAGEGCAAFASRDGMLFSKDMKTLAACPPGAGEAVVLPAEVESIGPGAFAGCEVASLTALGFVREIAPDAFDEGARASAVVALPAGGDYGARRAAWEAAGFERFAEPARPGDVSEPEAPAGGSGGPGAAQAVGLAFEVLGDYTLAASWRGADEAPADLVVPSSAEVGGASYRVSAVAAGGFAGLASLRSVELPASVSAVGEGAFAGCANLASATLPEGLRTMGARAFEATALADAWLPASLESVGSRALAGCGSLARVVALGAPDVAPDALAGCSGAAVYCPAGSEASWNVGIPAAGNRLAPYGVELAAEPLRLEVGQSASILAGGDLQAPDPIEASYSYAAKPLSVDADGAATGKAAGSSEVAVSLTLDGRELARASRTVEVTPSSESRESSVASKDHAIGNLRRETPPLASPALLSSSIDSPFLSYGLAPLSIGDVFDYEYEGSSLRYQVLSEPSGVKLGTCIVNTKTPDPLKPYLNGHVTVPETVTNNGAEYQVTRLQSYAFSGQRMDSITLPRELSVMASFVFTNCDNLKSIFIPKTLVSMGVNPFMGCDSLSDIQLEEGNPSYTVVDGVIYTKNIDTLIGGTPATVQGDFSIPEGVQTVRVNAFHQCEKMTSLFIPKTVIEFGQGYNIIATCSSLERIDVDLANSALACVDGVIYEKDNAGQLTSVVGCSPISVAVNLAIPETVQGMDQAAFQGVKTLEYVTVPASVKSMRYQIFESCENLANAVIEHVGPMEIGGGLFALDHKLRQVLALPSSVSVNMAEGGDLFRGMDASRVTVHCPESARGVWEAHGARVAPFSTNMPSVIGLPRQKAKVIRAFEPSIPADAPFSEEVALRHELQPGDSGMTMEASPDGRSVTFSHAGSGSATLVTELLYKDVAIASSTSIVSVEATSGPLPTQANPDNDALEKASWELSDQGTLTIRSTEPVGDLGWSAESDSKDREYWGSLRGLVKRADLSGMAGAVDMDEWFRDMPNLVDIGQVHVPRGVASASNLFRNAGISSVPDSFSLPDGLKSVAGMFAGCVSIVRLPNGLSLPDSVSDLSWMLSGLPGLSELPRDFRVPAQAEYMEGTFAGCTSLREVPDTIILPNGLKACGSLFEGCTNLASLPEDFRIPPSVVTELSANTFSGCDKLTVLPAKFAMPARLFEHPQFKAVKTTGLHYAGEDTELLSVASSVWSRDKRTFVVPQSGSALFKLSYRGGTGTFGVWTAVQPNVSNGRVIEPSAPHRSGERFLLWFADEACTKPFDFAQAVQTQLDRDVEGRYVIYGAYANGEIGGTLPTQNGVGNAFWAFDQKDGALYLGGSGVIACTWEDGEQHQGAWGPYRDQVKRIVMQPTVKAERMNNWFYGMSSLVDVTGAFIPEGARDLHRLFDGCTSLRMLPEGFSLPSSVQNLSSAFSGCASLTSLPPSFVFPSDCEADNVTGLFSDCTSLASLPEGFAIPQSVVHMNAAFRNCPSLAALPSSFDFPIDAAAKAVEPPFGCNVAPGEPRVRTHYAGAFRSVLDYDWEADGRTLVLNEGDMGDFGMRRVTFKVQSADEVAGFPWETRTVAWTDKQGVLADPGEPRLDGYTFSGWCVDEECLEPADFSQVLPDGVETLYGKWIVAGGRDAALPLASDSPAGTSAWWRLAADGELLIKGDGRVDDLGWNHENCTGTHWGPYRDAVRKVTMDAELSAVSLQAWFAHMGNLSDVSEVTVPDGVTSVNGLFYKCASIEELPEGFALPGSVEDACALFRGCRKLSHLPQSFILPTSGNLKSTHWMFAENVLLDSLPKGFTIPDGVTTMNDMFRECTTLASLPEGFAIPETVSQITRAFRDCPSLTSLPSSLKLVGLHPLAIETLKAEAFLVGNASGPVKTRYFGDPVDLNVIEGYWATQNREIVQDVPAGKVVLELNLPAEGSVAEGQSLWQRRLVDGSTVFSIQSVPSRAGFGFAGWFSNPECTTAYDLSKTPVQNGVASGGTLSLYGKYAEKEGTLSTTDGLERASWRLDADGTLFISCEPGAVIKSFGWDPEDASPFNEGTWNDKHWGFVRDEVMSVEMAPGVQTEDMVCWFAEMHNLMDVSGAYVPEGAEKANRLFFRCSSLQALPDGFALPEGVIDVSDAFSMSGLRGLPSGFALSSTVAKANFLFSGCADLEALPSSFVLPKGIEEVRCMFGSCPKLGSLPAGFTLPDSVTFAKDMFSRSSSLVAFPAGFRIPDGVADVGTFAAYCTSLEQLPEGFTVPANALDATRMFEGCTALKSLPDSFSLPGSLQSIDRMFNNCPSLTSLPASIDLSALSAEAKATAGAAFSCPDAAEKVSTVYAGDDLSRLSPNGEEPVTYWANTYNRALCATASKPDSVNTVSLVVVDPVTGESRAWTTIAVEGGVLERPVDPSLFGYAFDGWYAEPSFAADSKVAFGADGTAAVDRDLVLYGRYVLRVSYDVPLTARVAVDASGNVEAAPVAFRSFTPTPLLLRSVAVTEAPGAARLFPDAGSRKDVEVVVGVDGGSFRILLGGSRGYLGELPVATPTAPGEVPGSLSIDRNGAQIDFQPGEDITSFATLMWTVEAVR